MPLIRTDDGPRRLRAVWLGPKGFRWYWTWTYVQWFATFLAIVGLSGLMLLAVWALSGDLKIAAIIGPMWGAALGYFGVREAMKHVDYDRPVRYWRATLKGEWRDSTRARRQNARPDGWWIGAPQPRMMSRHALAYLGLSSARRPTRVNRQRPDFLGGVVVEASHNSRPPWTVEEDRLPPRWHGLSIVSATAGGGQP